MVSFKVCKECKGKCCTGPYITPNEYKRIVEETHSPCFALKRGKLLKIMEVGGICPYLGKLGCNLIKRPLSCRVYPLMPTRDGWIIRESCPFWMKITKEEIEAVKKDFEKDKEEWMEW
jgi:Fe-S-cluster containining protein